MKINRLGDNFTNLEKIQMLKIDELQEKIKLLEFDISKDREIISILKRKIDVRNRAITNAIKNIQLYDVNLAVRILKSIPIEEDNNDKYEV